LVKTGLLLVLASELHGVIEGKDSKCKECVSNTCQDACGDQCPGEGCSDCLNKNTCYCLVSCGCADSEWVEYHTGTLPLILSVSHGGWLYPEEIDDRTNGCKNSQGVCQFPWSDECPEDDVCKIRYVADSRTKDIGEGLYNKLGEKLDRKPHLIISKIHRSKLDPNREINEAAQGNPTAIKAYNSFHNLIAEVRNSISTSGPGMIYEIHGQIHKMNSSEVGYLISKNRLNSDKPPNHKYTSIRGLKERTGMTIQELIYGPSSLGTLLENEGFKALPSKRQKKPGDQGYFMGGYILKKYSSRLDGGNFDGIQTEAPSEVRWEGGKLVRDLYIEALAEALANFVKKFYLDKDLKNLKNETTTTTKTIKG